MNYIKHKFGPNETIRGALRLYNGQLLSEDILVSLMIDYNTMNNNRVPRMGDTIQIPLLNIDDKSS